MLRQVMLRRGVRTFVSYCTAPVRWKSVARSCGNGSRRGYIYNDIRRAAEVHEQIHRYARRFIRPGMKLLDTAEEVEASAQRWSVEGTTWSLVLDWFGYHISMTAPFSLSSKP